ncbi:hypothetical protein DEH18_01195 [Streptomyces sp. NHF165]|nr:Rv3654c family TadE-like protein [Streptomyces sp. NHF165]QHF92748.1 hypothetical protein DEH18_01195 [Streptomyces sp. NHF165]
MRGGRTRSGKARAQPRRTARLRGERRSPGRSRGPWRAGAPAAPGPGRPLGRAAARKEATARDRPPGRGAKRRRARGRPGADDGSATVWAAVVATALCVVFGALLAYGEAVAVRHRAGGAADLAALAAAHRAPDGARGACATARKVARAQHARVTRCALRGTVVDLDARVTRGPLTAQVRSRAGPAGHAPLRAEGGP